MHNVIKHRSGSFNKSHKLEKKVEETFNPNEKIVFRILEVNYLVLTNTAHMGGQLRAQTSWKKHGYNVIVKLTYGHNFL